MLLSRCCFSSCRHASDFLRGVCSMMFHAYPGQPFDSLTSYLLGKGWLANTSQQPRLLVIVRWENLSDLQKFCAPRTPEDVQRNVTVADVWTLEGEHIPSYMVRGGFLSHVEDWCCALRRYGMLLSILFSFSGFIMFHSHVVDTSSRHLDHRYQIGHNWT